MICLYTLFQTVEQLHVVFDMKDEVIATFEARGVRYQLIACNGGHDGFIVFTRVLNNWDLDDVDQFYQKENAIARYLYLISIIILEVK